MKASYKITILLLTTIFTLSCTQTEPYLYFSIESSDYNKIEVDNTTNYLDVNIGICDGVADIDIPDIPDRLILAVESGDCVHLNIKKDSGTIIKNLTLYYLDKDQNIKKLPFNKAIIAPTNKGLYPVILKGNISGTSGGKENIKFMLFMNVTPKNN